MPDQNDFDGANGAPSADDPARPHVEDLAIDFTAFVMKRFNDEDTGWLEFDKMIVEEFEDEFFGLTARFLSDNLVLMGDHDLDPESDSPVGRRLLFRFREVFVADYATEEVKNGQQILNAMVGYIDDTVNPKYVAQIEGFVLDLVTEFFASRPEVADKRYQITPHFVELDHTVLSNNAFTCEVASLFDWKLEFKVENAN